MNEKVFRPRSVTIISWILVGLGGLGVGGALAGSAAATSPPTLALMGVVLSGLSLVCDGAMLSGHNWGRIFYVFLTPLSFLVEGIVLGFAASQVVQFALYGVVVYFLTREPAMKFFSGRLFADRTPTEQ